MLRNSWAWLATLALFLVPTIAEAASQSVDVVVLHAEVPEYPPGPARALSGTVTVRVAIDQRGNVTSSEVETSLLFLTGSAAAAARKWTFTSDYKSEAREALLSFVFAGVQETEEPSHVEALLVEPLTMRVVYMQSTVSRLPRVDGKIAERRCPVHHEVMAVDLVPIGYGLPMGYIVDENPITKRRLSERKAYGKAKTKFFPESHWSARAGCLVRPETKAEVHYCQSCREAELAWLRRHPGFDPDE